MPLPEGRSSCADASIAGDQSVYGLRWAGPVEAYSSDGKKFTRPIRLWLGH